MRHTVAFASLTRVSVPRHSSHGGAETMRNVLGALVAGVALAAMMTVPAGASTVAASPGRGGGSQGGGGHSQGGGGGHSAGGDHGGAADHGGADGHGQENRRSGNDGGYQRDRNGYYDGPYDGPYYGGYGSCP